MNTLEAFRAAAHLGADGVELDVRRTVDGCLVIHHDIDLPGLGPISTCRHKQLPDWVPTLVDALGVCGELGLGVNVEVKSEVEGVSHDPDERCAAESAAVCVGASAAVRIVLSSFSLAALTTVREVSADLALAWLVGFRSGRAPRPWSAPSVARLSLEGVHPEDALTDAEYVERAHADGLAVRVWTVDAPARVVELGALGVEAVITNDVTMALRAVGRSAAASPG